LRSFAPPTDDRDKFAAERLHPKVATWCCRPVAVFRCALRRGNYAAVAVGDGRVVK